MPLDPPCILASASDPRGDAADRSLRDGRDRAEQAAAFDTPSDESQMRFDKLKAYCAADDVFREQLA
jgi:hypothetical protein